MIRFKISLEYGDQIEQAEAQWIRIHLPPYEEIWSRYIGNDGKNQALPLDGSTPHFRAVRNRFNQCHYSILVNVLILRNQCQKYQTNLAAVENPSDYLECVRELTGFMAHVGQIHDLLDAIQVCVNGPTSISSRFDDFYKSRSAVIHGSVVPMHLDSGIVFIPPFETVTQTSDVWTSKAVWSDCNGAKHQTLVDYMQDSFREACMLLYSSLSEVLDHLKQVMPNAKLVMNPEKLRIAKEATMHQITVGSSTISVPRGSGLSC